MTVQYVPGTNLVPGTGTYPSRVPGTVLTNYCTIWVCLRLIPSSYEINCDAATWTSLLWNRT
eukprot:scaffold79253_cov35-Attheya_sp.AAC.1